MNDTKKLFFKMQIIEEYKSNDVKETYVDSYLDTLPIVYFVS